MKQIYDIAGQTISEFAASHNLHPTTVFRHMRKGRCVWPARPHTGKVNNPEYIIWVGINQRVRNPKATKYNKYGGIGIGISVEWQISFDQFLLDMGPRPSPLHSVDRIDGSGNYCKENCRWATKNEQARNTKTYKGYVKKVGKRFAVIYRRQGTYKYKSFITKGEAEQYVQGLIALEYNENNNLHGDLDEHQYL